MPETKHLFLIGSKNVSDFYETFNLERVAEVRKLVDIVFSGK